MDDMRISGTEPSSVILSQICSIKKLVNFLSLLSPVSARVNRFEWRIDLLLMTQYSSGKDSKDMTENFEKCVTW